MMVLLAVVATASALAVFEIHSKSLILGHYNGYYCFLKIFVICTDSDKQAEM